MNPLPVLTLLLISPAHSEPSAPVAEEFIVYGDRFSQWDGTRWILETEIQMPWPMRWMASHNREFRTAMFQLRLDLHCNTSFTLGPHQKEVDCDIEQAALHAVAWNNQTDHVDAILQEFDDKLTGASVQLQVRDDGGVPHVDLEGLTPHSRRDTRQAEVLRSLIARTMSTFHLRVDGHQLTPGSTWMESDSPLLRLPMLGSSSGNFELGHRLDAYQGHGVVQSSGRGMLVLSGDVAWDYPSIECPQVALTEGSVTTVCALAKQLDPDSTMHVSSTQSRNGTARNTNDDLHLSRPNQTFDTRFDGVALFDRATGIMTERVWTLAAHRTAGSGGAMTGGATMPYVHTVRLRMQAPDEYVPFGPSHQVSLPGHDLPGVPQIQFMP